MDSRETKEQIAERARAAIQATRRAFQALEQVEAGHRNQNQSNASVAAEVAQTLEPNSSKKKLSISSIWSFVQNIKLQLSFSCIRRESFIVRSFAARVFSYKELEVATGGFTRRIAVGGFSTVYRGKLRDDRMVAVKVLSDGMKWVKEFTNEVRVLSDLRHPNIVSLYGCTDPGSEELMLVYEFVSNGTVHDHLQGKRSPLPWTVRIQIAIETAQALTYLHSLDTPVIHCDVKTSNVLLDNELHVKVADFGVCYRLPLDKSSVTTMPRGTQGYRDPDYDKSFKLTAKSDVYSFGVVLLELISGEQAVDVNRQEGDIFLYEMAMAKIKYNEMEQLIDRKLGYHYDCENHDRQNRRMIDWVAELACLCLQPEANERPSMKMVLSKLTAIRDWTKATECEPSKKE